VQARFRRLGTGRFGIGEKHPAPPPEGAATVTRGKTCQRRKA
jgi:hypothetical protein